MAAINTQTVLYNESFYDSTFEHPCESETTLPEYLPDVASIVRVDARPVLLDTAVCRLFSAASPFMQPYPKTSLDRICAFTPMSAWTRCAAGRFRAESCRCDAR